MRDVVILSGGMDSTTLLYALREQGSEVFALSVNYGQRHKKELVMATRLCQTLGIPHKIADLSAIRELLGSSSQTNDGIPVPHGHYTEESMKQTVVPNRNMIMLAVATGWAITLKADRVCYAAHAGDHAIYPDCRREFAEQLGSAIAMADWHTVHLFSPFVNLTKADICKEGARLKVPFSQTWSCYEGKEKHCGKCGTCVERIEAFQLAGVMDPTEYEDHV